MNMLERFRQRRDEELEREALAGIAADKKKLKLEQLRGAQGNYELEREAQQGIRADKLKAKSKMGSNLKEKSKEGSSPSGAAKAQAAANFAKQTGLINENTTNTQEGVAGGAMQGAASGAAFGPWGTAIGGVLGGVSGGLKAKAEKKRQLAKIEAEKQLKLGEVEQKKGAAIERAMSTLQQSFQRSLLDRNELRLF